MTTIRRQYNLPNCTLVLEGLSSGVLIGGTQGRPELSTLINAECRFSHSPQKLHGGLIFLKNLTKSVHNYAQECLSGIQHPQEQEEGEQVNLEKIEGTTKHRLTWQLEQEDHEERIVLELSPVELFDLVEAVDQFIADSATLPDFSLQLQPLSRRFRQADEPLGQRLLPAFLGVSSLAIAGFALYFLPIPEVRKPQPRPAVVPTEETTPENSESSSPQPDNTPPSNGE